MMAARRSYGEHDERPGKRRLKYAAKVLLDFSPVLPKLHSVTLAGALEVGTTNLAEGRGARLHIVGDGTTRALTFPAEWVFIGRTPPTELAAGEEAIIVAHACGSTDADVLAEYFVSDAGIVTLADAATVDLPLADLFRVFEFTQAGAVTFTTSRRVRGRAFTLIITGDGAAITWPAWTVLRAALPATIASGKKFVVSGIAGSTTEASIVVAWQVQP